MRDAVVEGLNLGAFCSTSRSAVGDKPTNGSANRLRVREGGNLPTGYVPETFLFAFVGSRIVGRVAIRHTLNAFLERKGGHIGYVVVPEFRRRGYATRMLGLALRVATEQLGIDDVLLVCADSNIGSIRVIERNGGVLQDVIRVDGDEEPLRRFRIRRSIT